MKKSIDEMTDAEKAWELYRKLMQLQALLQENYFFEFRQFAHEEQQRLNYAIELPF